MYPGAESKEAFLTLARAFVANPKEERFALTAGHFYRDMQGSGVLYKAITTPARPTRLPPNRGEGCQSLATSCTLAALTAAQDDKGPRESPEAERAFKLAMRMTPNSGTGMCAALARHWRGTGAALAPIFPGKQHTHAHVHAHTTTRACMRTLPRARARGH